MKSIPISPLFVGALVAASNCNLHAADWPQWRGPKRDGHSPETGLLQHWPKEGPKQLWKLADLGGGYSSPSIVGERVYVLSNEGMENESVVALSAADGKRVWSQRIGKVGPNTGPQYPGSRSTPTLNGDSLVALGSDGDLTCLDAATGKPHWAKNLRSDFGGQPGQWAYAESPLVDGDLVICTPGGKDATLVALNKKSGEVVWKTAVPGGDQAAYASIIIVETDGLKQYVQFLQKGLVGLEAKTGKFLWRYEKTAQGSPANIPTPVAAGGYVYSGAGRSGGGLIKLKVSGGAVETEQIAFTPKLPTAIGGAVKVGEFLYGTTGQATLCAEFSTGELKWEDRGLAPASLCAADGRLYLHGENGEVALIEASPAGYREHGRFKPSEPPARKNGMEKAWAYPAIASGRLYIRDASGLWCYDIKAKP